MVRIYSWRMLLGPRGDHQLVPDDDRHHLAPGRRPAVQQVRGDRGALDELRDLHDHPDLRGDEGHRLRALRGRARPGRELVQHVPARAPAADHAGHPDRHAPGLHPALHRLREPQPGRRPLGLHARQCGQRPGAGVGQPERRGGAQPDDARSPPRSSPSSPTGCRRSASSTPHERSTDSYDVAIVGGGHNGLVAAYYLARAGLRPVVLERREIVGGCCVTEEFAPGYRASTGAYVLSMLREPIWRDLRLAERGVAVDPAGPSLNLFADGARARAPRGDRALGRGGPALQPGRRGGAAAVRGGPGGPRRADHAADRHHPARPAPAARGRSGRAWRSSAGRRRGAAARSSTRSGSSPPRPPSSWTSGSSPST